MSIIKCFMESVYEVSPAWVRRECPKLPGLLYYALGSAVPVVDVEHEA